MKYFNESMHKEPSAHRALPEPGVWRIHGFPRRVILSYSTVTKVFSFERRHCPVCSDEGVQLRTAEVFNDTALFTYKLSRFNEIVSEYRKAHDISFTLTHVPGLEGQADWTGDHGHFIDCDTGERVEVHVFVMILPYSGYFYQRHHSPAKHHMLLESLPSVALSFIRVKARARYHWKKHLSMVQCRQWFSHFWRFVIPFVAVQFSREWRSTFLFQST